MEASAANKSDVREWILNYGSYDDNERTHVDDFVELHPEWEPVYRDARRWDRLFIDVKRSTDPDHDAQMLPYVVAGSKGPWTRKTKPLERLVSRIWERSENEELLLQQRKELEFQKSLLESETNVFEHFEAVTGARLNAPRLSPASEPRIAKSRKASTWSLGGRLFGVKLIKTSLFVTGVYLILFAASTFSQSPVERMAHLTPQDFSWTELGITTRGVDEAWELAIVNRYNAALGLAKSASRSFLGLFPSYRMDRLSAARDDLEAAMASQLAREAVPAAAYRTLAKLHFLMGDRLNSIDALREALRLEQSLNPSATGLKPLF